jgi:hypothetical protein
VPPTKSRAQERIEELALERRVAVDAAEYWRQQALQNMRLPVQPETPAATPEPKLEDFDYDGEKWQAAWKTWQASSIEKTVAGTIEQTLRERQSRERQQQIETEWEARRTAFRAKVPDYDVTTANPNLPITPAMAKVIKSSDRGPEIAYHLGKNPVEAARIARLEDPVEQAEALGRLYNRVVTSPAPPKTTSAPPPPTAGKAGASPGVPLDAIESVDDWMKRRREQLISQRKVVRR